MLIESYGRGGGAEQALAHVVPELVRRGVAIEIVVAWQPQELVAETERLGIRVHRLGMNSGERWNLAKALSRISSIAGTFKPDVMHAHLFFSAMYMGMLPAALSAPVKVLSLHNVDYDVHPARNRADEARKAVHGLMLRHRIHHKVAVSRTVARHYQEHLGLGEVLVIPNSIPTDTVRPGLAQDRAAILRRFGVQEPSGFVAVMPGRMVKQKGHVDLVDAVALLEARGAPIEVVMVGRGPLEEQIRARIVENGLGHRVHLHSVVPNAELMELLDAADAAVMPSLHEGFGIVAAEAMAMEKALIATNIGPLAELIADGETGILVPPSSPNALADGIFRVRANEELRRRLGRAARTAIVEGYSIPRVAERWVETYARISRRTSQG